MLVLRVLAATSAGWVLLLLAAPSLPGPIAAVTYAVGSLVCHQMPERSFYMGAYQLPVCARCLGVYLGGALAALVFASPWFHRTAGAWRWRLTPGRARAVLLAAALPTAVTVTAEWGGAWTTSNTTRALAGAPLGVGIAAVVIGAWATLHYGACQSRPPRASTPPRPPI